MSTLFYRNFHLYLNNPTSHISIFEMLSEIKVFRLFLIICKTTIKPQPMCVKCAIATNIIVMYAAISSLK